MKAILFLLSFVLMSVVSAQRETKTYQLGTFTDVKVSGHIEAEIVLADENKVEVVAKNEIYFEDIQVQIKGVELRLSALKGEYKESPFKVTVYCKSINDVKSLGHSHVELKKMTGIKKLNLSCQAGGHIVCDADADHIEASVSQGGRITLSGSSDILEAKVNTGGTIAAFNILSDDVVARINAGGEVFVLPKEKLDAKVTGGGTITYRGNPEEIKSKTLGGKIVKMGRKN